MPDSWLGAVLFLLLVAPGLVFDLLSDRRRPAAKESAFREVGRTILASLAFGSVGLVVAWLAALVWPGALADPPRLLGTGADVYLREHAGRVALSMVLQTAVAIGAAVGADLLLARRSNRADIRAGSGWWAVFRRELPAGAVPYVRVRTKSGVVWAGTVISYSPENEVANRELILGPPLASATSNTNLSALPAVWQRVVLRDDEIQWITVKYVSHA